MVLHWLQDIKSKQLNLARWAILDLVSDHLLTLASISCPFLHVHAFPFLQYLPSLFFTWVLPPYASHSALALPSPESLPSASHSHSALCLPNSQQLLFWNLFPPLSDDSFGTGFCLLGISEDQIQGDCVHKDAKCIFIFSELRCKISSAIFFCA